MRALNESSQLPSPKDLKSFLYGKVCFRSENFLASKIANEKFNVILCLSTLKYVHLTFGDNGVKCLFLRAFASLEDEGLFIIDPQPWKSYKKAKRASETTLENFNNIKLKPDMFKEYLEQIGFKILTTIAYPPDGALRYKDPKPLIVYQKLGHK